MVICILSKFHVSRLCCYEILGEGQIDHWELWATEIVWEKSGQNILLMVNYDYVQYSSKFLYQKY